MERFLITLWNMSFQAGIVICVVLLVRAVFSFAKVPKKFAYVLWMLPFLRLICPWSVESVFSLIPKQAEQVSTRQIQSAVFYMDSMIGNTDLTQIEGNSMQENVMTVTANHTHTASAGVMLAGTIWILGMLLLFLYSVISYWKLKGKLVGSICMKGNIYFADHIETPFVLGVLKPVIYVPSDMEKQDLSYVIAHEQTHIHRKDYLIKIAAFFVTCVYWFNPFVWIAYLYMGKDMEMSCDEAVMQKLGTDCKAAYANTLLELTAGRKRISGIPLAFGEGNTKDRIKNIMKYKKPWIAGIIFAVAILIILAVGLLTNPKSKETQNIDGFVEGNANTVDSELAGEYHMEGQDDVWTPVLILELDGSFSFSYDPLSSWLPHGTYTFDGTVLTGVTEDQKYFKFLRKEDGVFTFMKEESSSVTYVMEEKFIEKYGMEIKDGAEFVKAEDNISEDLLEDNTDTETDRGEDVSIMPPVITAETSVGADGVLLDFADENRVIFHGSAGLFVFSIAEDKMIGAVNLENIGCDKTQGDNYCEVVVEADGSKVYLHPLSEEVMYVYDVEKQNLQKKKYQSAEIDNGKALILVTNEYIEPDYTVFRSYHCAEVVVDGQTQYGYLESGSGLWKDICYVEGNVRINLFDEEK